MKEVKKATHVDETDAQAMELLEAKRENLALKMQSLQQEGAKLMASYSTKWEALAVKYSFDPKTTTLDCGTRALTRKE